jgi:hypothetical protein
MALDIPSLAQASLDKAWETAASVLKTCVVKQTPTTVYNPLTDATTTTWASTTTIKGLFYAPRIEEVPAASQTAFVENRMVMLLVRSSDMPSFVAINDVVEQGTTVWNVQSVFRDPSDKVTILTLQR